MAHAAVESGSGGSSCGGERMADSDGNKLSYLHEIKGVGVGNAAKIVGGLGTEHW